MQATKVPAEKKALGDSLLKYKGIADGLPAKVEVTNFQRAAGTAQLSLAFQQAGAKAATYSVTVDFLDITGTVVATDTQPVGPINKGETKTVTFKGTGNGIVAYSYKPLK